MATEAASGGPAGKLVIKNIGLLLSGDLDRPVLDADCVVAVDGRIKALAITAQRAYHGFRPAGVKVMAGAPVLEQGMVESDFKELAEAGVTLLGEVGLGTVKAGEEAARMVGWARKYGIQSTIHTGGP